MLTGFQLDGKKLNQLDTLHLAMFSGKGGVGKTTLSCGFARYWAKRFPQEKILLISSDPAHSLGDVLLLSVNEQPHPLEDLPNLQVQCLDAQMLLQNFKNRYGEALELLVERGSFVEGADLKPIWDLSWPGLDELMGLLEIQRILREREADRIVVDMAPSGHTLSLLGLMDFLASFLGALELFQEKHRVVSQTLTGHYVSDEVDRCLTEMKADLAAGQHLLQHLKQTACLAVAIAEPMSYLETKRFLQALQSLKIAVGGIFVNRLLFSPEQGKVLQHFLELPGQHPVWTVGQQPEEPVGIEAIDQLFGQIQAVKPEDYSNFSTFSSVFSPVKFLPSLPDFLTEGRRLVIVGGKGGVGKTTIAAAIAWGMAERHHNSRVRVISIDPAHSMGDVFEHALEHQPRQITANLSAQEVDAKQVLEQFREDYLWELADMMSGDAKDDNLKLAYGPQAWRQIVSQVLPGIDEMLSLITVLDLLEQSEQDLIILDTAPTGHLLRFLQMPTALGDWLAWIFRLWIKYQDVVGRIELMGRLRTLRQRVTQVQKKLTDSYYTEFIGVFQAQSAIEAETERLVRSLAELGIHQRYLVHNRYEEQQPLRDDYFEKQTIVRLAQLPGCDAFEQVRMAAKLLF
jgi:arsenite-transporting ATPase